MSSTQNLIPAPKINPITLWEMSSEEFNSWRQINDYPRIITFLKDRLPLFLNWMEGQTITDDLLIEFTPSRFLKNEKQLFIYDILDNDSKDKKILTDKNYAIGESFFYNNTVKTKTILEPYLNWYKSQPKSQNLHLATSMKMGNSSYFMSELEVLNMGNLDLNLKYKTGSWNLDFVNLDNLKLRQEYSACEFKISFSTAVNLSIEGDLPFLYAYNTSFYSVSNPKYSNLKLYNGSFQRWELENCALHININNSLISYWTYKGYDFNATLINSDIVECNFKTHDIKYPIDLGRAKSYHQHIKILYSQLGKKKEAAKHFLLERKFERKSFLELKANYRQEYKKYKEKSLLPIIYVKFIFKYIYSGFLNLLWGYGEIPSRVLLISVLSIFSFAIIFCYSPNSAQETFHNYYNSLYFSMVTFATLGYGDISQNDTFLKLLSGFEAIFGMTMWGILIAGFTGNSKDY